MTENPKAIAVIGCSGAIGSAFTKMLCERYPDAEIYAFSQHKPKHQYPGVFYQSINYADEHSIEAAAATASKNSPLERVIVATGMLHDENIMPEKSLKSLSAEKFRKVFEINTIVPALLAKHFLPKLNRETSSILAALSARVGSISDNQLGGWYAYRASKAALNMIIKNAAIELERFNKQAMIIGLHPGTVDSALSKPFQDHVPEGKLFTPEYSVQKLLEVIETVSLEDSGKCFAWDGQQILP